MSHAPISPLNDLLALRVQAKKAVIELDAATVKLVIFALNDMLYAFHGHYIVEILPYREIFFVPGCPASIAGVIYLRGDIESVLRLAMVVGTEEQPLTRHTAILLGRTPQMQSGLRVDRVLEVMDIPENQIQPPLATFNEKILPWVDGVFTYTGQMVILLDLSRLFQGYQAGIS
ncbi:MAG: chemotaxis protein CheW [Magnetococcus sp. DMHC-6]